MADKRKLQGEIERCMKKVTEGVEAFEDNWQKVYSATNVNQKEKYEADLKKEIKKLQRLRDQIKTWQTSSDIKDKRSLQEARRTIETQMERFKVVERETKTKAYSKEGLGAAQKLDPAQREKDDINAWLTACIESLNIQIDKFESDIDSINFSLKLKKKKNDKDKLDQLEEVKARLEKHKYHINQLEALLRMLDNGTVEVDQIKKIKEDVEYYRDCSQDPDFQDNEFLYVDLNLEDLEDYLVKQQAANEIMNQGIIIDCSSIDEKAALSNTPTSLSSDSPSHSPDSVEASKVLNSSASAVLKPPSPTKMNNYVSENSNSRFSPVKLPSDQPVITSQMPSAPFSIAVGSLQDNHYKISLDHESVWSPTNSIEEKINNNNVITKPSHCSKPFDALHSNANHLSKSSSVNGSWVDSNCRHDFQENGTTSDVQFDSQLTFNGNDNELNLRNGTDESDNCQNGSSISSSFSLSLPSSISTKSVILDDAQSTLKKLAERAVLNSGISNHIHNLQFSAQHNKGSQLMHTILGNNENDLFIDNALPISSNALPSTTSIEINLSHIFGHINNLFSVDELLQTLDAASKSLPLLMDSQRLRYLSPGGPTSTPDYYPTSVSNCNSMEFFQRLSAETLFFIFYFLQGTKAQYYAAKALKMQSWRFHTMFMMWFQRHEEPKTITDEYEQGTYIYFDFEKWSQRKKECFTFEYKYLEDRDLK